MKTLDSSAALVQVESLWIPPQEWEFKNGKPAVVAMIPVFRYQNLFDKWLLSIADYSSALSFEILL